MSDDEITNLTLDDVCLRCGFTRVTVTAYIQEGLLDVEGEDIENWRFAQHHLITLQRVHRLENDLRLNAAGAVLAHELMLEIEHLKSRLHRARFG